MERSFEYDLAGRKLSVTIGKVAEQANGACIVQIWGYCCTSNGYCF